MKVEYFSSTRVDEKLLAEKEIVSAGFITCEMLSVFLFATGAAGAPCNAARGVHFVSGDCSAAARVAQWHAVSARVTAS